MILAIAIKLDLEDAMADYDRLAVAENIVKDLKRDLKKWEKSTKVQYVEGKVEKG